MGIVCLCVLACSQPKRQIEPISKEITIPRNTVTVPKDSIIIPKKDTVVIKKDTVIIKIDTVKTVISVQDTVKKKPDGVQIFEFYDITSPDISISFPSFTCPGNFPCIAMATIKFSTAVVFSGLTSCVGHPTENKSELDARNEPKSILALKRNDVCMDLP